MTCSYACLKVLAILSKVARLIVIVFAVVVVALYISCSCVRAWNMRSSALAFVESGAIVGDACELISLGRSWFDSADCAVALAVVSSGSDLAARAVAVAEAVIGTRVTGVPAWM